VVLLVHADLARWIEIVRRGELVAGDDFEQGGLAGAVGSDGP
jgi:hypothetical protein